MNTLKHDLHNRLKEVENKISDGQQLTKADMEILLLATLLEEETNGSL